MNQTFTFTNEMNQPKKLVCKICSRVTTSKQHALRHFGIGRKAMFSKEHLFYLAKSTRVKRISKSRQRQRLRQAMREEVK